MKNTLNKILLSVFILSFLFSSVGVTAASKSAAEKKKEIEQKMAQADKDYKTAMEKKLNYDDQAAELQTDIDELDDIISSLDGDITESNNKIEEANVKLNIKKDSFAKRLRALQKRGAMSYMDVIFGADNFSDFLVRLTLVGNIIDHDKSMINEIAVIKSELTAAKNEIEGKRSEQQEAKDLVVTQQSKLSDMADKQESAMSEITANQDTYKKEYAAALKQMQEEDAKIKAAAVSSKSSSGGNVTYKGKGGFIWPVPAGGRISCRFGYRTDPVPSNHTGIDIAISTGNAIVAAKSGTVSLVTSSSSGYGKYVMINHGDGTSTLYAHTSQIYVAVGQTVVQGERIAAVGSTGFSTGPHLHFEIRNNGTPINPESYIT